MARRFALTLLLVGAACISGCASYTSVREHKNLADEASRIGSIVILPEDVTIELIAFTGENERLTDKQNDFARQLHIAATNQLGSHGLKTVDYDFDKNIAADQNLAFAITQCKDALAKSQKSLYKKPVEVKNRSSFTESVGAHANTIADATGADAILVLTYNGFEKTAGMKTKDVVAGALLGALTGTVAIAPGEGGALQATLIAADSGAILWTNTVGGPALSTSYTTSVFAEFPKVAFNQTAAATVANAPAAVAPSDNTNADVATNAVPVAATTAQADAAVTK